MKDVEAHAAAMKTSSDAALLRNRMVALLEEAAQETDETRQRRLMSFVVAGGGFAGVETVGAMNDFLGETVEYYPQARRVVILPHFRGHLVSRGRANECVARHRRAGFARGHGRAFI